MPKIVSRKYKQDNKRYLLSELTFHRFASAKTWFNEITDSYSTIYDGMQKRRLELATCVVRVLNDAIKREVGHEIVGASI